MTKLDTVRIRKTEQLDQRKLLLIARRYGISPMSVRELQLGYSEDVPKQAAEKLIIAGYVTRVKTRPREMQERVDSLTTRCNEAIETTENEEACSVETSTVDNADEQEIIDNA